MPHLASLRAFYTEAVTHLVPGPASVSYFFPIFVLTSALCIPPSVLSRSSLCLIFLPIIYALQIHACMQMGTVDVISNNIALWSLLCLGLRDVRRDFRQVYPAEGTQGTTTAKAAPHGVIENGATNRHHENGGPECEEDRWKEVIGRARSNTAEIPYPATLKDRLPWVSTLLISLRLNNWKTGDSDHDKKQPPQPTPPYKLLISAISSTISSYLILELTSIYTHADPYFHQRGFSGSIDSLHDIPFLPNLPSLLSHQTSSTSSTTTAIITPLLILPRLLRCSVLAAQIYALVPFLFNSCIPFALFLHHIGLLPAAFSPHTWPPIFGSFWQNVPQRGLRGLWGGWWHQMNRITTAAPGRALAEALGLKVAAAPEGEARKLGWRAVAGYLIVACSAFGFSGLMHMGLVPPVPRGTSMSPGEMRWRVAAFFWMQIPGFAVELLVSKVATKIFSKEVRTSVLCKALTLVWTAAFLCVTLPIMFPAFRELGYWKVWPMPVSVVHGLTGQGWVPWAARRG